jgi:hypothetical protein
MVHGQRIFAANALDPMCEALANVIWQHADQNKLALFPVGVNV